MSVDAVARNVVDVTVICVTYRSGDLAPKALRSALGACVAAGLRSELIVVDNASDDGTADAVAAAVPEVAIIRNTANVGFGSANNQAFEVARGQWWLLLNPDASLEPDAVARLTHAMSADPRLAVAGPSVGGGGMGGAESAGMLPGIRSLAGHFLFINRLLPKRGWVSWRGFQVRPWAGPDHQEVEWVSAAAVLLRPEAVKAVGGFDPSIFLYGEDLDLCARLLDAGWRVRLVPAAHATHAIGGSQDPGSTRWLDGLDLFLRRRGAARWRRTACFLIIAAGLAIRALPWRGTVAKGARAINAARMRSGAWRALAIALGREASEAR